MANLKIGSTGDEVRKVQEALGFTGKDVDGIYGTKTENAVVEFQRKNGAKVDGIVGNETRGLLFGGNSSAGGNATTPAAPQTGVQGADVQNAAAQFGENPGDWWKHYNEKAQGYMGQIESREPFSFEVNSDPLYEQLKDQYIQQGQMASMDVMGQAAAMTGGYGNSYAQQVGQQAYYQHLGQLNDVVPELYEMAYGRYEQEGQDLYDKYQLYAGARDTVKADMDTEKGNLINLIAATGYKPTDAELEKAGMTRDQANSYATAHSTSSAPKYKDLDAGSEAYNTITTDVKRATTLADLQGIVARYISLGYNPDHIEALTLDKYNELLPEISPTDTNRGSKWYLDMRLR